MNVNERKLATINTTTEESVVVSGSTISIIRTVKDATTQAVVHTQQDDIPLSKVSLVRKETPTAAWDTLRGQASGHAAIIHIYMSGSTAPVSIVYANGTTAATNHASILAAL